MKIWRTDKTNIIILASVVAVVLAISIFLYQYSVLTSNKIVDIASGEVRSNTRIEAHDISQILTNKLQTVGALLQTLADSPAVHNNEYKRADTVINTRQHSSNDFTDFYMWLNKDGKINWISNINSSIYQKYKGTDLSYRPYYTVPKQTHTVYYSSLIESNDKIPRLYISYPVIIIAPSHSTPARPPRFRSRGTAPAGLHRLVRDTCSGFPAPCCWVRLPFSGSSSRGATRRRPADSAIRKLLWSRRRPEPEALTVAPTPAPEDGARRPAPAGPRSSRKS